MIKVRFLSRPACLPVLARLWRPRHTGKIAYARELVELIAARYPDRTVHVVARWRRRRPPRVLTVGVMERAFRYQRSGIG